MRGVMCVLSIVNTVQRYAELCIHSLCYGKKKTIKPQLLVAFGCLAPCVRAIMEMHLPSR